MGPYNVFQSLVKEFSEAGHLVFSIPAVAYCEAQRGKRYSFSEVLDWQVSGKFDQKLAYPMLFNWLLIKRSHSQVYRSPRQRLVPADHSHAYSVAPDDTGL